MNQKQTLPSPPLSLPTEKDKQMQYLQSLGYHGPALTLLSFARDERKDEIHIIGNRAGCLTKLYADLMQAGCDVRVLFTRADMTTPIIAHLDSNKKIQVKSYTDEADILGVLEKMAKDNPVKKSISIQDGDSYLKTLIL